MTVATLEGRVIIDQDDGVEYPVVEVDEFLATVVVVSRVPMGDVGVEMWPLDEVMDAFAAGRFALKAQEEVA